MGRMLPPRFEVTINRMSHKGYGVGDFDNRSIFVYGTMPGERLLVYPLKKSSKMAIAGIDKVLVSSSNRREPREDHYLSCSPWQVIEDKKQDEYKLELTKKLFKDSIGEKLSSDLELVNSDKRFNYRNKMEFSFVHKENGEISLAFHQRGKYWAHYELESCVLAHRKINECAKYIVEEINFKKIPFADLKNLVLRYSYFEDKCLVVLFVKNKKFINFDIDNSGIVGWQIIYSDPLSPATVITKILHKQDRDYLTEEVSKVKLNYYYDSFFQINPKAFDNLIKFMKENIKSGETLIDLYSGVGTIGLCLANKFEKVVSIESNESAVEIAKENAVKNSINNIDFLGGASEKQDLDEILSSADYLVVDPPRCGMHPRVIKKILKHLPENFVYVSCNPSTQERDLELLKEKYKPVAWKLFDFYPQTPHVESVIILKRDNKKA
jgi:23S rRNA (uracil1939-C5)-methyltransferase